MTIEIAILLVIIIAMILLMAFEVLPTDTIAVSLMVILILTGLVSPQEGISGLSNEATITVLALMILSIGLEVNGVVALMGSRLKKIIGSDERFSLFVLLLIVGTCSALISTTAVVIVFMRIMIKLSRKLPLRVSRFLMPLSFAGIMGGSCTLLGTSTNLLVSSIAEDHDIEAFGVFEFTHIGVIFFIFGIIYLVFFGRHLLPDKTGEDKDLVNEYELENYLTEIVITEGSALAGMKLEETPMAREDDIDVIEVIKEGKDPHFPMESDRLKPGDILLVRGDLDLLSDIRSSDDVKILFTQSVKDEQRLNTEDMMLCEVIVRPSSRLVGRSLDKLSLKQDFYAMPLAVKKPKGTFRTKLGMLKIEPGDTLLLEVGRTGFEKIYNSPELVVLEEHDEFHKSGNQRFLSSAIMLAVILLAAFDILPILVSALSGCVAMFLTGCLKLQNAYRRVDWNIIFLLAGVIPLGIAMDNTGASELLASGFVQGLGDARPELLIAGFYLVITLLSAVMSNNATAILFAPIAISIAANLDLDPRPLLLTVMFAANMSFISPIGYQTNTLVYGAGEYRFGDFMKVGGFLSLVIWILTALLIPYFYF